MTHPSRQFEEDLKVEVEGVTRKQGTHLIITNPVPIHAGRKDNVSVLTAQHWLETYEWEETPDVCDYPGCIRPPHEEEDIELLMADEYQPPIEKPLRERLRGMSLADLYRRGRSRGFFKPTAQYN